LTVSGLTALNGGTTTTTLLASGAVAISDVGLAALDVAGGAVIGGTLQVSGAGGTTTTTLTASGLADLNGNLDVAGTTVLGSTLTVSGAAALNGGATATTLNIAGAALGTNELAVNGEALITGATTLNGGATVNNAILDVNAGADIANGLTVSSGVTQLNGGTTTTTLTASGAAQLNGGTTTTTLVANNQTTLAATNITGITNINTSGNTATNIGNATGAGSATNVNGTLTVAGASTVAAITASGLADLNGNLDVAGTTVLGNTLTVNSTSDLNGSVDIDATVAGGYTLDVENTSATGNALIVRGGNTTLNSANGAALQINNSNGAGYGLKSIGSALVIGYVEGATNAAQDTPLYQIGTGLDHPGNATVTTGLVIGGDADTRNRMIYNSTSGAFVVGPERSSQAATTNDFFTVNPSSMNVTLDATGTSSGSDVLNIVHASSDNNSSAIEVTNAAAASGSSSPLVRFNRTTGNNGAALEVSLNASTGLGAGTETYALEVTSSQPNNGAIFALANDAAAVAGFFDHAIPSATALQVETGTLLIQNESNGGGARLAGGIELAATPAALDGNSLVFRYTGAANSLTLAVMSTAAPIAGTIMFVHCENNQDNVDGATDIQANGIATFVYSNGAWRLGTGNQ